MDTKDKNISRMLILSAVILVVIAIIGGLIWEKVRIDKTFADKAKAVLGEAVSKLKLDKVPFLKKFVKEEAAPPTEEAPEEAVMVKVYKVAK